MNRQNTEDLTYFLKFIHKTVLYIILYVNKHSLCGCGMVWDLILGIINRRNKL